VTEDYRWPYSAAERTDCLDPLAARIHALSRPGKTLALAIQGGQGTGKTTLAHWLTDHLAATGLSTVGFSLDDFYRSAAERAQIAAAHPGNPYYQLPRGMPGTHRTEALLDALQRLRRGDDVDLPRFDKSLHAGRGDIAGEVHAVRGRQDLVVFEGWCAGIPPVTAAEVIALWHRIAASDPTLPAPPLAPEHLSAVLVHVPEYQPVWALIDYWIVLRPDSPALHLVWREQQEAELRARTGQGLSPAEVRDLVRHFLPFTYPCYERIRADLCIGIDHRHRYYRRS
jgi:D-glycerate 3-kinase